MAIAPEDSMALEQWRAWHRSVLPPVERRTRGDFAIDRVSWLDATIRNSGWIEVLAASHDGYLEEIASSLEAIGAQETLEILKKCVACFPENKLAHSWQDRERQIEALSADLRHRIDDLNEEYYSSREDICALAIKFWENTRNRPEQRS